MVSFTENRERGGFVTVLERAVTVIQCGSTPVGQEGVSSVSFIKHEGGMASVPIIQSEKT